MNKKHEDTGNPFMDRSRLRASSAEQLHDDSVRAEPSYK